MIELTRLEEILLMAILRLKENAYGVTVKKEIEERAGKKLTIGALYFALDQLFKKGYVAKSTGDPTPERGGRSKTFYQLTPNGIKGLECARELHANLWDGVSEIAMGKHEKE
ncbi:MAG: PadR family transcriptional regulator [bacterium]|nr:PadR family transcriptional regulator [bacterium]